MPIYPIKNEKGKPLKKDGVQKYRVVVCYTNQTGQYKNIERTVWGYTEAQDLEKKLRKDVKWEDSAKKKTVQNLYNEYIEAKKAEWRGTTLRSQEQSYSLFVKPYFENIRIDKLSLPLLQQWKNTLEQGNYSLRYKQLIFKKFSAILEFGVTMEYLARNPLKRIGNFKSNNDEDLVKEKLNFYNAEEWHKYKSTMLTIAKANEAKGTLEEWGYFIFFCIAFYMGTRKGETNALKWSDIAGNIMHVRRSIYQKVKGGDIEGPTKGKRKRSLQIPLPLIEVLNEHKARQQQMKGWNEDYRICGGDRVLRDSSISNKNIVYSKAAELKTITIHDFRHSNASLLANKGIDIQEIAKRLGHRKIDITWNTYCHLYPKEEERAMAILNEV